MTTITDPRRKEFWALEDLGRIRLSSTFYLRDFLYSEIAATFGLPELA